MLISDSFISSKCLIAHTMCPNSLNCTHNVCLNSRCTQPQKLYRSRKAVTAAVKAAAAISAEPIKSGRGATCKGSNFILLCNIFGHCVCN